MAKKTATGRSAVVSEGSGRRRRAATPPRASTRSTGASSKVIEKLVDDFVDTIREKLLGRPTNRLTQDIFDTIFPLRGWNEGNLLQSIVARLGTHRSEKEHLARYLIGDLRAELRAAGNPIRLFIESGSTLAFFAKELADEFARQPDLKTTVLTNNFLAQLMLFGITSVAVTAGELRHTYLAYLPFRGGTRKDCPELSEHELFSDRLAFLHLDQSVAATDTIYCTGSTFGLLVGPLSGTRDNAIFKYCLLNNRARRRIKFCIAEPKVFAEPRYSWDRKRGTTDDDTNVRNHLDRCFLLFDIQPQSPLAVDGSAIDATAFVQEDLRTAATTMASGKRAASHELGLSPDASGRFLEGPPIAGAYGSWLDFLENEPPGRIEIVIGCGDQDRVNHVVRAAVDANRILAQLGHSRRYHRRPTVPAALVVHLEIVDDHKMKGNARTA